MHIKMVTLEGFKTYKEQTVLEPFDKGHNVILGKNGSGKSNVFDAIQFVLSDKYGVLRTEERQSLLHEGSGREIMSASVEIIFDNQDMRFPIEKEEISLKRTIGLKKDEYFLDNKHVSKAEVVSLLESAGLSRSNPYYIVQQGKVRSLIKMKNSERLELLKEIAGTRTYDERRKESLKIMTDTDKRRNQITEVIEYIEKRLKELESEKSELKAFQELDSERRALEYTVYDQEMTDAADKLDRIENSRANFSEKNNQTHSKVAQVRKRREKAEEELNTLHEELGKLRSAKQQLGKDRRRVIKRRAQVELRVKSVQDTVTGDRGQRDSAENELKGLHKQVKSKQSELKKATVKYNGEIHAEEEVKKQLELTEQHLSVLYAKQGRGKQYKTKAERDAFLKTQIKEETSNLASEEKQMANAGKERKKLQKELDQAAGRADSCDNEKSELKGKIDELQKNYTTLKRQRDSAQNRRKELWREENGLEKSYQALQNNLTKAKKDLQYTMDKHLHRGLEAVKQIVKEENIQGFHGPLIELFECEAKFHKCVETTAGNSLFHLVVDSDAIASRIIKILNKRKMGRVTFVPLNQIREKPPVQYPKSIDVIPMIERLETKEVYRPVLRQVFGKTIITRDLSVASQFARTHDLNAITLGGDQVNQKGALTGGFLEFKKSRLGAQERIRQAQDVYDNASGEAERIKATVQNKDQEVAHVLGELEKNTESRKHLRNKLQQCDLDLQQAKKDRKLRVRAIDHNAKLVDKTKSSLTLLKDKLAGLQTEIKTVLQTSLSKQETTEMHKLNNEVTDLKKSLLEHSTSRSEAETTKNTLDNLLTTNLLRRQEELTALLGSAATEESTEQLEKDSHALSQLVEQVEESDAQLQETETMLEKKATRERNVQVELEGFKNKEEAETRKVNRESKNMEKLLNKRSVLVQSKEDCHKKIRDLGSLPQQAFDKFKKLNQKQLMNKLEKCSVKLKKYSHVNKKAIDQYMNFADQREDLLKRKKELDKGRVGIMELIDHLDLRKDEAIERTFKGIAKHFSTVFSELVPDGKGTLVIQTKKKKKKRKGGKEEKTESDDEEEDTSTAPSGTQRYSGVGIKVSFTGGAGDHHTMLQLSGGQQSVVALSLIFAIQRCDPSPFYLFDEIDSNLDAVHRASVARMIHSQSKRTQFITTTFRPEMLKTAAKFYGVTYSNKMSKVNVITREEARQLIEVVEKEAKN